MEEYKSNSNKSKKQLPAEEQRVKPVVTGTARIKKKSTMQKFAETFIAEDIANVRSYVLEEVIIPTAKDIILDSISMMLNGSTGYRYRSGNRSTTKVSYERNPGRSAYNRVGRGNDAPRTKQTGRFDFQPVIFPTRGDAEMVIDELCELADSYPSVSAQDLYSAAGLQAPWTYSNFGWYSEDIRRAPIVRDEDGFMIKLPKPEPLN